MPNFKIPLLFKSLKKLKIMIIRSISTSSKHINILEKSPSHFGLIYSPFSLHLHLYTMFPPWRTIRLIESSQTFHPRTLRIASEIPEMLHLPPQRVLCRLEIKSSYLTLSQMPMLYGWHLLYRWSKRSLETRRLKEMPSTSSWWLIRHLKI